MCWKYKRLLNIKYANLSVYTNIINMKNMLNTFGFYTTKFKSSFIVKPIVFNLKQHRMYKHKKKIHSI